MRCALCDPPRPYVLFESTDAFVQLHDDWAVRGHVMIVARKHVENVSDLTPAEWRSIADLWHRTERVLLAITAAERSIVMKLGIQTPHLHLHLYPVSAKATREDVFATIDGSTRVAVDPLFADRLREALAAERGGG